MRAQHTPGPWTVGYDMRDRERVFAGQNEIVRALSEHGSRRLPKAERDANRRLIAAAPESHECTLLLESLCAWLLHRFGPDSPEGQEASVRLSKARTAIAKANGTDSYFVGGVA